MKFLLICAIVAFIFAQIKVPKWHQLTWLQCRVLLPAVAALPPFSVLITIYATYECLTRMFRRPQ